MVVNEVLKNQFGAQSQQQQQQLHPAFRPQLSQPQTPALLHSIFIALFNALLDPAREVGLFLFAVLPRQPVRCVSSCRSCGCGTTYVCGVVCGQC